MTRVLFLSENLQLGGPTLIELWRCAEALGLEIAGIWSNAAPTRQARLGRHGYEALVASKSVALPDDPTLELALFDGVSVADYAQLAGELEIPYQQIPNINASSISLAISALEIDLGICIGYGRIFKSPTLHAPKRGWVNFHPSLLPKERGPFPGFWEFRKGAKESGVSLHEMSEEADQGDLIRQASIEIEADMDFRSLLVKQAALSARILGDSLGPYLSGALQAQPQAEGGTSSPKPKPEDFLLSADMTCSMVESFVRGLRGVATPIVVCDGSLFQVEGVTSKAEIPFDFTSGHCQRLSHERLDFYASDGKVGLLVSPQALPMPKTETPVSGV